MFGGIGAQEIILILLVLLLLFGAKRLPEIAQGLGKGIREFKKAMKETSDELNKAVDEEKKLEENQKDKSTDKKE